MPENPEHIQPVDWETVRINLVEAVGRGGGHGRRVRGGDARRSAPAGFEVVEEAYRS
jgi:hypothetical protein